MENQDNYASETITPAELHSALTFLFGQTDLNVAIEGAPGTAKTAQVKAVCKANEWALVPFRLGDREAVEVCGAQMPDIETGTMRRFLPAFLADVDRLAKDHDRVVVFFDEFNKAADPATMNAARQMILDGEIEGEYAFPPNVRFCIAVNRLTDRSGDERIPSHVANSFIWLSVRPDARSLIDHAVSQGWDGSIVSYLSWRADNGHVFDPKRIVNVTFRNWEYVNEVLRGRCPDKALERKILAGALGPVAHEFEAFRRLVASALDHAAIQADPTKASLPDEMEVSEMFAAVASCAAHANADTMDAYCAYIDRLGRPEFSILFTRLAEKQNPEVVNTLGYGRMAMRYAADIAA